MMNKDIAIRWLMHGLLVLNTFTVSSIFRVRAYGQDSLDFQILFKLGVWAVTFGICLLFIRRWGHYLLRFDNIALTLLLFLMTVSCFYAPSVPYALGSVFSVISTFALLFCAAGILPARQIICSILTTLTIVSAISIALYFIHPDFARMKEWVGNTYMPGVRLSGITGTANTMGFLSAFSLLLCTSIAQNLPRKYWVILGVSIAISLMALFMSNSRTSMVGLLVSLAVYFILSPSKLRLGLAFFTVAALTFIALFIDWENLYSLISRSGDAREITSGTGRVYIWKTAIDLTADKILTGWGYASSVRVLPDLATEIGFMPPHTHNMFLQVAFATGIGGLFLFAAALLTKTYFALKRMDRLQLTGILFMIITGLTEASAFQGVATTSTLALATILILQKGSGGSAADTP
jgi:exopolysaccharide production protein ExoQ